ncbi:hypothetical protein DBV39_18815 [Orrella marina]|uniref:Lipid A biosynthesis lauroyl acyltransferase n=1 Tax=Orrella marina TaxID=2163011 RepID=A0A2R4XNS0_9BURK|nr:hypothetical protein DBV39_18815 [Orrella marina]
MLTHVNDARSLAVGEFISSRQTCSGIENEYRLPLDREEALRYLDSSESDRADRRSRANNSSDPAGFLAAELALQKLCLEVMATDARAERICESDFLVESLQSNQINLRLSGRARRALNHHLLESISARIEEDGQTLVVVPVEMSLPVTRAGRFIGRFLPYRRKVIEQGMRRVYGERVSSERLHQLMLAHYSHLATLLWELLVFRFKSVDERAAKVRVQGEQMIIEAFEAGKGMLILTGHFGNFEVSTVSGIEHFPLAKGRIHFLRRPIKPRWLSDFLTRRFNRAGFGVIGRRGSLEEIVNRLESGEAIVFPFDQYAHKPDGISVPLFGVPTGTYKSMAVLAMATGAPVISGSSWREPDGSHVLKFWGALEPVQDEDVGKEISRNTEMYNRELERMILYKPEQWWWVHRRWKNAPAV